jgi:hypothetical protein
MNKLNRLNKCDFCKYKSNSGCMVTPTQYYCKEAVDEYYQYINNKKQPQQKSLRSWDRR